MRLLAPLEHAIREYEVHAAVCRACVAAGLRVWQAGAGVFIHSGDASLQSCSIYDNHISASGRDVRGGAGEGRALMSNQKPAQVIQARKDFDVFNRKPKNVTKKPSVWSLVR